MQKESEAEAQMHLDCKCGQYNCLEDWAFGDISQTRDEPGKVYGDQLMKSPLGQTTQGLEMDSMAIWEPTEEKGSL